MTAQDIEQINRVYSKFNMTVTETTEGLRINKYKLLITSYDDVSKFVTKKMLNNLIAALGENSVKLYQDGSYVVVEKPKKDISILKWSDVIKPSFCNPKGNSLRLILGKDIEGHTVVTSLAKAPHMLVSGCTGSGKTVLLHSFIASILLGNQTTHLILIDPKGNEFNVYKDIDTVEFISDVKEAISTLNWLVGQMNARYKHMQALNTTDFKESGLTQVVVVIDEFADLIMNDKSIEKSVVMLAQKARGAGIHLIIGTQYPKIDVLTGLIRANVPTRVCLKVEENIQSRVAINVSGGEKLLGNGDLLFKTPTSTEVLRIQSPYIDAEDKRRIVEEAKKTFAGKGGYIKARKSRQNDTAQPIRPAYKSKQKRVGLIRGLINLMKVKPIMFQTDEYPPKI